MVLGTNGEVVLDEKQLSGFWSMKRCPYEVLEKSSDDFRVECAVQGLKLTARARFWHLLRPRLLTHGVITVESVSPGVPNLVVATFRGRELSKRSAALASH